MTEHKDEMFEDGAQVILDGLAAIADAVGKELEKSLETLAKKVRFQLYYA